MSIKSKVLIITQWFDPEPTIKGISFAKELANNGLDVTVITAFPNYPGGKIYKGYTNKWGHKEKIDNIKLYRVPIFPSHSKSIIFRILNYLSFSFSSLIKAIQIRDQYHVIYAYHPPLSVGLVAIILKKIFHTPVVYDIQDLWPASLSSTGIINNKLILNVIQILCLYTYRNVDRISVLSEGFKKYLINLGVNKDKIQVIYNWSNEFTVSQTINTELPSVLLDKSKFKILFAGNIGEAQALGTILEAARIVEIDYPNISFIFLGNGIECDELIKKRNDLKLSNVHFLEMVSMLEATSYLQAADILLLHLKSNPLFEITIPSKTQAYMSQGKPILMGLRGEAAELIRKSGGGVLFEPENSQSLASAAIKCSFLKPDKLKEMGASAYSFYNSRFSFKIGTKKFIAIIKELLRL